MDDSTKRQKKGSRKSSTPESHFQSALATCTKSNNVSAALAFYETAVSQNIRLTPSNFNTLLYLCSSSSPSPPISAIESGFGIFDSMLAAGIAPTEATLTAVARLAAAKSDGDLAFRLVKDNAAKYGVALRLRTYAPAIFAFCANEEPEKAYEVEAEMVANGIPPEEAEIAGLLKVSHETGRSERVYSYLHKLRNAVKCVKEETAVVIERWFKSEAAMEAVGGSEGDENSVREVISKNGGGWYGIGWLGKGGWEVSRTRIEANGVCGCCGERLVCLDASDEETERFAGLICGLAIEREAKSGFSQFKVVTLSSLPLLSLTDYQISTL
ncbi:hypothetical protein ACLOJK_023052 [Asimina triloba]